MIDLTDDLTCKAPPGQCGCDCAPEDGCFGSGFHFQTCPDYQLQHPEEALEDWQERMRERAIEARADDLGLRY